ncbi:MAG: hypothetical protein WCC66_04275 [Rhizobiaceae bacterium]
MNYATIVPWMLTLVSLTVSAWQYNATTRQKNLEPFLKTQLEFTLKATDSLASLAVETDPAKWEESRKTFWKLYWGSLAIVEDKEVEKAMVRAGALVPKLPVASPVLPMTSLNTASLDLAHKARALILNSWGAELPPLDGK